MLRRPHDDLEARVARLERHLNRVLELLQERASEGDPSAPGAREPFARRSPDEESTLADAHPGVPGPHEAPAMIPRDPEEATVSAGTADSPPEATPVEPLPEPAPKLPGSGLLGNVVDLAKESTLLGRLGIALLLLSVAFFFKYSIDQGWLTEWVRLAVGFTTGVILLALGFKGASRGEALGTVLAGGGIATFFITGFVGHQWFGLLSYPAAFGFLVLASGLGVLLALLSGLQALAVVGMIGALATPIILPPPTAQVRGLALYVALVVASVSVVYLVRAWRAVFLLTVLTSWWVLGLAVSEAPPPASGQSWVLLAVIWACALTFWLIPLGRVRLWAGNPGRWPRPESAVPAGAGGEKGLLRFVAWNLHLDALSLLMPLVGIGFSEWLWDLSRPLLAWVFLATAALAQAVGAWMARSPDPEDSAATQRYVAIILSTVGLALLLTGDTLYAVFMAEAVALIHIGYRKKDRILLGFGIAVELIVGFWFFSRIVTGAGLLAGEWSSLLDVLAIAAGFFIGTRLGEWDGRRACFAFSYLALLALFYRELSSYPPILFLTYIIVAVMTQLAARRWSYGFFSQLGHIATLIVVSWLGWGLASGRTLHGGEVEAAIDLAALGALVWIGVLLKGRGLRLAYFYAAFGGFLAWTYRELHPLDQAQALTSLAFGVEGATVLIWGFLTHRALAEKTGMATLLLVVGKILLVDLAAVEPIWRVMLLFLFAVLFLGLSRFLQVRRVPSEVGARPSPAR